MSAFRAATAIDPTYAAAYAGLALAKLAQATIRDVLVEAFGEAKAAALRALALDDQSADAQVALGQVMFLSRVGLARRRAKLPARPGHQPESR